MQLKVGDKAVYPGHGVAEVVGVETKEIGGRPTPFFLLQILGSEMRIMVPTANAHHVGLRCVASHREVDEVFDVLRETDVHIDKQTWNRRYRGFMEKIKTGSLFEVAEVFRDLSRLKNQKTLSYGERRMLESARNLIVKELSVARNWPLNRVEKELDQVFAA